LTQLVQILLTDEQAKLLAAAADVTLRSNEDKTDGLIALEDTEKTDLERLATFMAIVATEPGKFPLEGRMAQTLKTARRTKTPNPNAGNTGASTRNKRKDRQERRARTHIVRRLKRREFVKEYNRARIVAETEIAELTAIQEARQKQIESEPKFDLLDTMGTVIMSDIPQSMIRPVEEELTHDQRVLLSFEPEGNASGPGPVQSYNPEAKQTTRVILPGTAEALDIPVPGFN